MASSSPPPVRSSLSPTVLLRRLPVALVVTVAMLATAYALWLRLGTLDPASADIGGGPIGALAGGAVGGLLAAVDVARRGLRPALPTWATVAATTLATLLVLIGARSGPDPFLPVVATFVAAFVLAPVGLGLGIGSGVRALLDR